MNFVSYAFLLLLATVLLVRITVGPRKVEPAYLVVLVIASIVFYGWHVPSYLLILVTSTVVDYVAALVMGAPDSGSPRVRRRRNLALVASLTTNLGLLGIFKYADFGIESLRAFLGAIGVQSSLSTLELVLPMGISFYTFQSMSYTIDVYRGRLRPVSSFARFFLFVSFFPQLVAGPIVRATEFLPQLGRPRRLRARVATEGLYLMVLGFFLKTVCADNLATYVDQYWSAGYEPGASSIMLIWVTLLFSAQIFSDFAGYTAIARGVGYLLGFRLPINFNGPYVAGTFKNFWERWHITLSRWLRDYLYIPLGGNRLSSGRTMANLMIVMVLGGLWHGAAFTFVAWGTLHGVALAIERLLGLQHPQRRRPLALRLGWYVVVQATVLVTWIFFRSETLAGALQFLRNIAAWNQGPYPAELFWMGLIFVLPVVVLHVWTVLVERRLVQPLGPWRKAMLTGAMLFGIMTGYGGSNAFIYFQF